MALKYSEINGQYADEDDMQNHEAFPSFWSQRVIGLEGVMVGGAEARIGEEVLGRLGLATATVCWTLTVGLGELWLVAAVQLRSGVAEVPLRSLRQFLYLLYHQQSLLFAEALPGEGPLSMTEVGTTIK
ncbi:hypothetical protein E2C01_019423 [Portunus trituberculatus]|uniref:Uncharacterized protein n=1 Tax=Portunus trituberculatus TaxID=210409 RepID=A0A5B7DYY7_PORTR|nr:hypothetical protein [Portunus trituberculatus]